MRIVRCRTQGMWKGGEKGEKGGKVGKRYGKVRKVRKVREWVLVPSCLIQI